MVAANVNSWDGYYHHFNNQFDPRYRLIIYLLGIEDDPDLLDELEENDYEEAVVTREEKVRVGEYFVGECLVKDELGESYSINSTMIFHDIPRGWREADWYTGGDKSHKKFVFDWFDIAPQFVRKIGIQEVQGLRRTPEKGSLSERIKVYGIELGVNECAHIFFNYKEFKKKVYRDSEQVAGFSEIFDERSLEILEYSNIDPASVLNRDIKVALAIDYLWQRARAHLRSWNFPGAGIEHDVEIEIVPDNAE